MPLSRIHSLAIPILLAIVFSPGSLPAQVDIHQYWTALKRIPEIHFRVSTTMILNLQDTSHATAELWLKKDEQDTSVGYQILMVTDSGPDDAEADVRYYSRGKLYFWNSRSQRGDVSSFDERWNYGFANNWSGSRHFPGFLVYEDYLENKKLRQPVSDSLIALLWEARHTGDTIDLRFFTTPGSVFPYRFEEIYHSSFPIVRICTYSRVTYHADPEMEWRKRCLRPDILPAYVPEVIDESIYQLIDTGTIHPPVSVFHVGGTDTFDLVKKHAGSFLLLDMMYFSCPPCNMALPVLDSLHQAFHAYGLKIASVNPVDPPQPEQYTRYLNRHPLPFPLYAAPSAIRQTFNLNVFPSFILIDPDGIVRYTSAGLPPDLFVQISRFFPR